MTEFGISQGGRSAEELFLALTGAQKAPRASLGDAVLEGHAIEVKRATSATLNQVRAVKYIVLVAYFVPADTWYVVPPHEVVRLVARKKRGQHTENPFESATLSTRWLVNFEVERPEELRQAVLVAIQEGSEFVRLREAMQEVLAESRQLAERSIERVQAVLNQHGS